jgi:hypothetical protein
VHRLALLADLSRAFIASFREDDRRRARRKRGAIQVAFERWQRGR